eukprot:4131688-Pyramimonas_sp.AAC.1
MWGAEGGFEFGHCGNARPDKSTEETCTGALDIWHTSVIVQSPVGLADLRALRQTHPIVFGWRLRLLLLILLL